MKKHVTAFIKPILGGAFLCIVSLFLTSCENFLKGAGTRKELEDAIEIANSNPVSIFITPDENAGIAVPNQIQAKKNQTFMLTFQPSSNYEFIKWEVLNRKTREPVENVVKFEDETALETKVTILKAVENLLIYPKCVLVPAVSEITPNPSGQNSINTPIIIKLNMPMDDSIVDKIQISYFGTEMSEYFEKPYLNEKKDEIIIRTKSSVFIPFISSLNKSSVDINICLPDTIVKEINGKLYSLQQNDKSNFAFHYVTVKDNNPPEKKDFFLSREYIKPGNDIYSVERFNDDIFLIDEEHDGDAFIAQGSDLFKENLCGSYVYLYGIFNDKETGINKVEVFEQFCGDNETYDDFELLKTYTKDLTGSYYAGEESDESWFYIDKEGLTTFCIKHYLNSPDGAVKISACVKDIYENGTNISETTAFKLSKIPFGDTGWSTIQNDIPSLYTEEGFYNAIRNVLFSVDSYDFFGVPYYYVDMLPIPDSFYTIKCEYLHTNGTVFADTLKPTKIYDYEWKFTLDVEKLSGLHLNFIITDIMGNEYEKQYTIPLSEDYKGVQLPDSDDPTKATIQFVYKNGEFACAPIPLIIEDNTNTFQVPCYGDYDYDKFISNMQADYKYKYIPQVGFDYDTWPYVTFYTEIPDYEYSVKGQVSNPSTITLANYEGTSRPYKITKNEVDGILDLSVKISEDSWDKGYTDILLVAENNAFGIGQVYENVLLGWNENKEYNSKLFDKTNRSCECSMTMVTDLMFEEDTKISVYGVKDGVQVLCAQITIPQFTSENEYKIYDNVKPSLLDVDLSTDLTLNDVILRFKDFQSGVSTTKTYIVEGVDVLEKYGNEITNSVEVALGNSGRYYTKTAYLTTAGNSNEGYITIPRWLYTDTGFTYYLYDRAGNVKTGVKIPNDRPQYFKITNIGKTKGTSDEDKDKIIEMTVSFHWINTFATKTTESVSLYAWNDNGWNDTSYSSVSTNNAMYSGSIVFSKSQFPENKFVKVVLKLRNDVVSSTYAHPSYIYTGLSNSGDNDYVYPPFEDSISIKSDAPVLVRTVVTSVPYEECKNWTVEEWEDGRHCIKEDVLNFSTENTSPKVYKMYNDDPNDTSWNMLKDKCYIAVIHFANGRRVMSTIMQK